MEMVLADIALRRMFDDMRRQMIMDAQNTFDFLLGIIASHHGGGGSGGGDHSEARNGTDNTQTQSSGSKTIYIYVCGIWIEVKYDPTKKGKSEEEIRKMVMSAITTQYYSGDLGKAVVNNLSCYSNITLDFTKSSKEIADIWNQSHDKKFNNLGGLSSWNWNIECMENTEGTTKSTLSEGTILLASEFLQDKTISAYDFESYETGFLGITTNTYPENLTMNMTLAHEMKHGYDSNNCNGPMDFGEREASANLYMYSIWNYEHKPRIAPYTGHH